MSDLVEREWQGPFDAFLPDRSIVRRGDKRMITPEQAESGHWKDPDAGLSATPYSATLTSTPAPAASEPATGEAD